MCHYHCQPISMDYIYALSFGSYVAMLDLPSSSASYLRPVESGLRQEGMLAIYSFPKNMAN